MAEQNKTFKLGQTVMTCGVDNYIRTTGNVLLPQKLLQKHSNLEQGDLCDEDYQQNLNAVKNEGKRDDNGNLMQDRVFSSYKIDNTIFWVISEWDRSCTTILLPNEY